MTKSEQQISGFNEWHEVYEALTNEIDATREKQSEISLFDGKRKKEKNDSYYYSFILNANEYIDQNNITEIRYNDRIIEGAAVIKIKGHKVIVSIPISTLNIPSKIPVLILVNDPSFILQKLLEAISYSQTDKNIQIGFIDTLFGTKSDINDRYDTSELSSENQFDFNIQQYDAIKKSKSNKVLFIWGPPGTGKTTVLGKIISDFIKLDETVLVCSNTNRAVDVSVLKAIEVSTYETTPIKEETLRWGNVFLTEEEDMQYVTLQSHILRKSLQKESKIQKEVDLLKEYDAATKALNVFNIKNRPYQLVKKRYSELQTKEELNEFQSNELIRLKRKIGELGSNQDNSKVVSDKLRFKVTDAENRIKELFDSVSKLRQFVFSEIAVTIEEILKDIKFQAATFARTVIDDQIKSQSFDNIVIDEASMANLPYILFLCTLAKKRLIFVGDPQQLAPIVVSRGNYSKQWLKKDIFLKVASVDTVQELFDWQRTNSNISTLLTDQYRMPKKIFDIVNRLFYADRLVNKACTVGTIKVIDTSNINPTLSFPSEKIKSPVNVNHSELLIEDVRRSILNFDDKKDATRSIGVMVPFTQQKRFIQYLSKVRYLPDSLEIGVVHTFQGREKPKIYFDLTLSNIDFTYPTFDEFKTSKTDVSRLLNVAISRCQSMQDGYFDGEFILIANIDYFRKNHPNGIVFEFITAIVESANSVINITEPVNPFKMNLDGDEQIDVFEQVEADTVGDIDQVEVLEGSKNKNVANQLIKKEIENNCKIIINAIQSINHYGEMLYQKEIFKYTSTINEVLTKLPITLCQDKDSFRLFIDMMYKLIYESSGGREAVYPVWDRNAKLGKESYGKIRLVIHQIRQYYFHDFENWEEGSQRKLLAHVHGYFKAIVSKNDPENTEDWVRCQLVVLFKTTEYLGEVSKKLKRKIGSVDGN
jgi:hypothetical protein